MRSADRYRGRQSVVTLTFDLQNLIRSAVWVKEYSL